MPITVAATIGVARAAAIGLAFAATFDFALTTAIRLTLATSIHLPFTTTFCLTLALRDEPAMLWVLPDGITHHVPSPRCV